MKTKRIYIRACPICDQLIDNCGKGQLYHTACYLHLRKWDKHAKELSVAERIQKTREHLAKERNEQRLRSLWPVPEAPQLNPLRVAFISTNLFPIKDIT